MRQNYLTYMAKLRGDLAQGREAMFKFLILRLFAIILASCSEYELWKQRKAAHKQGRLASRHGHD